MTVVDHTQVKTEAWNAYVSSNAQGNIYHTTHMFDVLKVCPGVQPFALFVLDAEGQITALMSGYVQTVSRGLLSSLSRRAVITQTPLYNSKEALQVLLNAYSKRFKSKVVYTEVRNHVSCEDILPAFTQHGFTYKPHLNYLVDCSNPDAVWKQISESKRRQIKKAMKNGVTINDSPSMEQVKEYYHILNHLYVTRVHKPLFPWEYFAALYCIKDEEYSTRFLLIMLENKVIGGIVCPISRDKTIHEGYIAGLDTEYKDEYPSVMATWAAIDYAGKHGIKTFDFMGAGSPDQDYGVREFKAKFGGELVEHGRFHMVNSRLKYYIASTGFGLLQKLKRTAG